MQLNHLRLAWTWVSCLHSIKLNTQDEKKSIVKSETVFTCLQDQSIKMNYFIILIRHTSLKIDSEDAELIFAYLQLLRSRAFSRQIIIILVESSVIADKNIKLSTIFFSCWNNSWCKIERACDCWLSFELSKNWFSMYKRVTIFIRLSWYVLLNIALFMMMILNYCVISINRLNQCWLVQRD